MTLSGLVAAFLREVSIAARSRCLLTPVPSSMCVCSSAEMLEIWASETNFGRPTAGIVVPAALALMRFVRVLLSTLASSAILLMFGFFPLPTAASYRPKAALMRSSSEAKSILCASPSSAIFARLRTAPPPDLLSPSFFSNPIPL